ncbi:MAG: H-type lectin domain-containing protein [Pseudomonadota bacterium]
MNYSLISSKPNRTCKFVAVLLISMISVFNVDNSYAWRLEAGRAVTSNTLSNPSFRTVTFDQTFDTVPIVIVLPTDQGGNASTLRIRNITTSGFDVAPLEPPSFDGLHLEMDFDYIAIEPGIHEMPSGEIIVAGRHTTSSVQRNSKVGGPQAWDTVSFGTSLSANASIVATIQTMNNQGSPPLPATNLNALPWLTMAVRNPNTSNVQMALERSEVGAATDSISAETIGYIAFPQNTNGSFNDINGTATNWSAIRTAANITGWDDGGCNTNSFSTTTFPAPRVVATKNTRNGSDGGWLRRCSLSGSQIGLEVDEDTDKDGERNHIGESAGILAFSRSFHANFNQDLVSVEKTVEVIAGPIEAPTKLFSIPGATVRYTLTITNSHSVDMTTTTVSDELPLALEFEDDPIPTNSYSISNCGTLPSPTFSFTEDGGTGGSDLLEFSNLTVSPSIVCTITFDAIIQ